jgi:hypothetical protein
VVGGLLADDGSAWFSTCPLDAGAPLRSERHTHDAKERGVGGGGRVLSGFWPAVRDSLGAVASCPASPLQSSHEAFSLRNTFAGTCIESPLSFPSGYLPGRNLPFLILPTASESPLLR